MALSPPSRWAQPAVSSQTPSDRQPRSKAWRPHQSAGCSRSLPSRPGRPPVRRLPGQAPARPRAAYPASTRPVHAASTAVSKRRPRLSAVSAKGVNETSCRRRNRSVPSLGSQSEIAVASSRRTFIHCRQWRPRGGDARQRASRPRLRVDLPAGHGARHRAAAPPSVGRINPSVPPASAANCRRRLSMSPISASGSAITVAGARGATPLPSPKAFLSDCGTARVSTATGPGPKPQDPAHKGPRIAYR